MQTHSLLFRPLADGFAVLFHDAVEGNTGRELVLSKKLTLHFSFTCNDPMFYVYTANLPADAVKNPGCFSNVYNKQQAAVDATAELQRVDDAAGTSGSIEIQLHPLLPEKLYIRFANRAVYWRYFFIGNALEQSKNLAVIDGAKQHLFGQAEWQTGQAGETMLAITSVNPIAMTQHYSHHFALVSGYDASRGNYDKKLVAALPGASPAACHALPDGTMFADIYVYC